MTLNEYQKKAHETAVYPHSNPTQTLSYCALGLAGEAGEVANEVKKIIRDDFGVLTPERYVKLVKEMGDVLWYLAELCSVMPSTQVDPGEDLTLDDVAMGNLIKLHLRAQSNTIRGGGNER
jgi:NTP pyrophosphatase (non-canonical NTP hydrolase)